MENLKVRHIAIIPDGNRRWAKLHGLPALQGHQYGSEAMHDIVDYLVGHQLKYLTVWGFSTDNWKRSEDEVNNLFRLLAVQIEEDTPWLNSRGIKLRCIGRISGLPALLQLAINQAVDLTKDNINMTLTLAFNYTGKAEILDAVNHLVEDDPVFEIDEQVFERYLDTKGMPDVDLVIRTAGEFRLSNFMLWQTAYSEFYFTDVLWPDFSVEELEKALKAYASRQRRFGGE